jgi:hypothetical protein
MMAVTTFRRCSALNGISAAREVFRARDEKGQS